MGASALILATTMLAAGCGTASDKEESNPSTAPSTANPDFTAVEDALNSQGWKTEAEFDWSNLQVDGTQSPQVRKAVPAMGAWAKASIFSDAANQATSTTALVEGVQKQLDSAEYDYFADSYSDDPAKGLESAAAYGLVIDPTVKMSSEPRVAVSTAVDDSETDGYVARVDMTARAVIPLTDGSISRWGMYLYNIQFKVPQNYLPDDDGQPRVSVATASPGLTTCDWTETFSAGVADDGTYDRSRVLDVIEFAKPDDSFTREEYQKVLKNGKDIPDTCDQND